MNRLFRALIYVLLALVTIPPLTSYVLFAHMPGTSASTTGAATSNDAASGVAAADPTLAAELEADVRMFAETIGVRHVWRPEGLAQSVDHITGELERAGYTVARHSFEVRGVTVHNLEAELAGHTHPDEIVIVGAHYDSHGTTPGANDNASGTAATLAIARRLATSRPGRTLRFVFFVNEEPPFFQTDDMGSLVYARRSRERGEDIRAMLSLETMGYFDDTPGSQRYPIGHLKSVYPDRGDFIAFVGNVGSRALVREIVGQFRQTARIPSEGAALPGTISGVGWSDHWAFWQVGYPAVMVTDTAPFRYAHYHTVDDTPDKLDYPRMALVFEGLLDVLHTLARIERP